MPPETVWEGKAHFLPHVGYGWSHCSQGAPGRAGDGGRSFIVEDSLGITGAEALIRLPVTVQGQRTDTPAPVELLNEGNEQSGLLHL